MKKGDKSVYWQISILYDTDGQSTILLTVKENCFTGELFQKFRQHPNAPKTDDFQLISIGGSIRRDLEDSWTERLLDYDVTDRSTLVFIARQLGGVWPTAEEVFRQRRTPKSATGITLTTIDENHPDVFGYVLEGLGVTMRCGHTVAPMSLALYCHSELERGQDEIRCPECKAKWKFTHLKPAAALTPNEITEFEARAQINYFKKNQKEMNPCPKCGIFCHPHDDTNPRVVCANCSNLSGQTFEFCWRCLGEWKTSGTTACGNPKCGSTEELFEILKTSKKKILNRMDVPSTRACPNCSVLIHHKEGCKHMTCRGCGYEFCFICLSKYPCVTGDYEACLVASIQTSDTVFAANSD